MAAGIVCISGVAFADAGQLPDAGQAPDAGPAVTDQEASLGEVVVTANRYEEVPFLTGRSIDIISRREIQQRQPRTVPEALRESPGVFVQETNMGGGSPIVRGMVGPEILILLDGIRMNNAVYRTGPLQYLNFLDTYEIDRMEVVRGPGSVLYGSDAMGATINAITFVPRDRRALDGFGGNFQLSGRYGSAAQEKTGDGQVDLGYSWFGANASVTYKDFVNLEGGRGVGIQPYTSYSQLNASGKLIARVPDGYFKDWTATLGYHMARIMNAGRAEQLETKQRFNIYQDDDDLVYGRGEMLFKPIFTDLRLTVYYQRFYEDKATDQMDRDQTYIKTVTYDRITVNTAGVDGQFNTSLLGDRLRLVYGAEYHKDFVDSSAISVDRASGVVSPRAAPYPAGSSYELGGAYLTMTGELLPLDWNYGLRLTGGCRYQFMGGAADAREALPAVDYAYNAGVFMLGVQGSYRKNWTSSFTWSQGFRAPNLDETVAIGDVGGWYQIPNNSLGPERSNTFELMTRFDAWRLSGSLSGYASLVSDFIRRESATYNGQSTYDGLPVVRNGNGGDARIYGAEGQLKFRMWWGLSLAGSVTYTYGEELLDKAAQEKDPEHRSSRPLSKIPPLFGDIR
ncbi:MAG: TonB-dependent receptor, partial [Myxococcota bacterium]